MFVSLVAACEKFLEKKELTFETYVLAVAKGDIRCDRYVLLAITSMWNISITIISPVYSTEWKVHHDSVDPDIVILSNGHQFGNANEATHYSSTILSLKNAKKVGYDTDLNVKIIEGQTKGVKAATQSFKLQEAEDILRNHYAVSKRLKQLKHKVKNCEEILYDVEEELATMKINKNALRRFHTYMDDLTPDEQVQPIDVRPFLLSDSNVEHHGYQIPPLYPKATATVTRSEQDSTKTVEESTPAESSMVHLATSVEHVEEMPAELSTVDVATNVEHAEETVPAELSTADLATALPELSTVTIAAEIHQEAVVEVANDVKETDDVPTKKRKASSEVPVAASDDMDFVEVIVDDSNDEIVVQERQHKKVKARVVDTSAFTVPSTITSTQSIAASATASTASTASSGTIKKKIPLQLVSRKNRSATGPHPDTGRDPTRHYCPQCPKHFAWPRGLTDHLQRCGQTKKQYKCGYCPREFFSSETCQNHIAKEHLNLKRHICNICGAGFFTQREMLQHSAEHMSFP